MAGEGERTPEKHNSNVHPPWGSAQRQPQLQRDRAAPLYSLKISACNDFDLAAVQCEAVPISRCSGWKQKCFWSEAETWIQVLHISSFTVQHWAASQPSLGSQIAKPPRCTWALSVTAHGQSFHTENSSRRMGLKTGDSGSNQQDATGSCCLFLATWQCTGYLWCKS